MLALEARTALEVGPGGGLVTEWLRRAGVEVTTLDMDPELGADVNGSVTDIPLDAALVRRRALLPGAGAPPVRGRRAGAAELARVSRIGAVVSVPDATPWAGKAYPLYFPGWYLDETRARFRLARCARPGTPGAPRAAPGLALPALRPGAVVAGRPHAGARPLPIPRGPWRPEPGSQHFWEVGAEDTPLERARRGARPPASPSSEPTACPRTPGTASSCFAAARGVVVSPLDLMRVAGRLAGFPDPSDYGAYAAYTAAATPAASPGSACSWSAAIAARTAACSRRWARRELHGLDVIDDVGADFPGPTYHRMSAEQIELPDERFDSCSRWPRSSTSPTWRPLRGDGTRDGARRRRVYSVAAPLWNSRQATTRATCSKGTRGCTCASTATSIVSLCRPRGSRAPTRQPIEDTSTTCSTRASSTRSGTALTSKRAMRCTGVELIRNDLALDEPDGLTPDARDRVGPATLARNCSRLRTRWWRASGRSRARPICRARSAPVLRGALLERAPRRG